MKVTIGASALSGNIIAPTSKSSMQRALAAALLKNGKTIISNPGQSNDDKAALDIIQRLGATVKEEGGEWIIESKGIKPVSNTIDCGESGLSIRMFTLLAALSDQEITVDGSGSLVDRPLDFFDKILPKLQVSIKSNEGKLPLVIHGPLKPVNIEIDGSLSSQFLTGLLMAYSAIGAKNVSIKVKNLKSKPYINLTLDIIERFGFKIPANRSFQEFAYDNSAIDNGDKTVNYNVEGDWSGGAFLLVAGAIAGPITVRGLDLSSSQADKAIIDALMTANAGIAMEAKGIKIHPATMNAFYFDATDCPDLFPPLVALAAYCKGQSTIKGVSRLAHKESNRALTLQEEFAKLNVDIRIDGDRMTIHGGKIIKAATVKSHHDHRVAMALAVAALKADGKIIIEDAEAVDKSYPDFYKHIKYLGADIQF
jgi:3-phosphoshikimate 1-carboxyvinyltransferase